MGVWRRACRIEVTELDETPTGVRPARGMWRRADIMSAAARHGCSANSIRQHSPELPACQPRNARGNGELSERTSVS